MLEKKNEKILNSNEQAQSGVCSPLAKAFKNKNLKQKRVKWSSSIILGYNTWL